MPGCTHRNKIVSDDHCPDPCNAKHVICTDCHEIIDDCFFDWL